MKKLHYELIFELNNYVNRYWYKQHHFCCLNVSDNIHRLINRATLRSHISNLLYRREENNLLSKRLTREYRYQKPPIMLLYVSLCTMNY